MRIGLMGQQDAGRSGCTKRRARSGSGRGRFRSDAGGRSRRRREAMPRSPDRIVTPSLDNRRCPRGASSRDLRRTGIVIVVAEDGDDPVAGQVDKRPREHVGEACLEVHEISGGHHQIEAHLSEHLYGAVRLPARPRRGPRECRRFVRHVSFEVRGQARNRHHHFFDADVESPSQARPNGPRWWRQRSLRPRPARIIIRRDTPGAGSPADAGRLSDVSAGGPALRTLLFVWGRRRPPRSRAAPARTEAQTTRTASRSRSGTNDSASTVSSSIDKAREAEVGVDACQWTSARLSGNPRARTATAAHTNRRCRPMAGKTHIAQRTNWQRAARS